MQRQEGRVKAYVALLVLATHAWLLHGMLQMRVDPWIAAPKQAVVDASLAVEFVFRRRSAAPVDRAPSTGGDAEPLSARRAASHAAGGNHRTGAVMQAGAALSQAPATRPLDLTVHAEPAHAFGTRRHWLERKPAIDARRTRFDDAWAPAGNALEQARFRSPAVRVALGLFGGPPRRCNEVERRLREPDCLPHDNDEPDPETLRRARD
jgi:hypothetical protein